MKKIILLLFLISFNVSSFAQVYFSWGHPLIGVINERNGKCATIDSLGNTYIIASFNNDTADFDPGPGIFSVTTSSPDNIYISKFDSLGNFIWVKPFLSSDYGGGVSNPTSIFVDKFGNIYSTGFLASTLDLDPGSGTYSTYNAYISKLDPSGNFVWARTYFSTGGSLNINIASLAVDDSENVIITGNFCYTVDFDPGVGVYNLTSGGGGSPQDAFVSKLNAAGDFVWAKRMGENLYDQKGYTVCADHSGNIYTVGSFPGTVDFDPGSGVYNLSSGGNGDIFVQKLSPSGNFIWAKQIAGGPYGALPYSLKFSDSGNLYISGQIYSTVYRIIMAKIDTAGVIKWSKTIGNPLYMQECHSIELDENENVYITGYFNNTVDFDPGIAIANLTSAGGTDIYIAKYDSLANFIWAKRIGGASDDYGQSLTIDKTDNIVVYGAIYSDTVDVDPGLGVYTLSDPYSYMDVEQLYLFKWSQNPCSNIEILIDSVANVSCSEVGFGSGHAFHGQAPYSYSWNTTPITPDSIATFTDIGIYTLTVTDSNSCVHSSSVLINGPVGISSNTDEGIDLVSDVFRKGFTSFIYLNAFNNGCDSVDGQVFLVLDTLLSYNYAIPPPSIINGDTLIWNYYNLNYDSFHIIPKIAVTTPLWANIDDTIHLAASITPLAGDVNIENNSKSYEFRVRSSYDPNEKLVYPVGKCTEGYVLNNQKLTYTVRFQNTGTASAINIAIIDSLNSALDLNTLRILGYSHSAFAEILSGNAIKFHFNNINLPDSTANDSLSHGYIIFEIQPVASIIDNTILENTAYIYFDFNLPIVTNTVSNTFVNELPVCNTGILENKLQSGIFVYPNPSKQLINIKFSEPLLKDDVLKILDVTGRELLIRNVNKQEELMSVDISSLSSGLYFIMLGNKKNIFVKE